MHYWETTSHARELRARAQLLMDANEIAPTPLNYELCFFNELGQNRELQQALAAAIEAGQAGDGEVTRQLHSKFVARATDREVDEASARLEAELKQLASVLETTGRGSAAFGATLGAAAEQLARSDVSPQIKSLIDGVAIATRHMAEKNKALESQVEASAKEVETLRASMEAVRKESLTDQLTGLANRRSFDEGMLAAIAQADSEKSPFCVLMCDVDHFKKFNDTWGHATGDQVLRLVAHCVKSNVKGRDLAARYGGEELVVVLPATHLADAMIVAEQIRKTVESRKIVKRASGESLGSITLSIGVAQYGSGESGGDLVGRADACLYAAKRTGRNRVCCEVPPDVVPQAQAAATAQAATASGRADPKSAGSVLELEFADRQTEIYVDPEVSLIDERLKRLHQWWTLAAKTGSPQWHDSHIDGDLAFLREALHVYDAADDGTRFRIRFVGAGLIRALGQDTTGIWLSAAPPQSAPLAPALVRAFDIARLAYQVKTPLRTFSKSEHVMKAGRFKGESLCLPFFRDGAVEVVLAATILTPANEAALQQRSAVA